MLFCHHTISTFITCFNSIYAIYVIDVCYGVVEYVIALVTAHIVQCNTQTMYLTVHVTSTIAYYSRT
jgi:hypothetical protein